MRDKMEAPICSGYGEENWRGWFGPLIASSVWNTWPSRPRSKFRFTPDGDLETDAASERQNSFTAKNWGITASSLRGDDGIRDRTLHEN